MRSIHAFLLIACSVACGADVRPLRWDVEPISLKSDCPEQSLEIGLRFSIYNSGKRLLLQTMQPAGKEEDPRLPLLIMHSDSIIVSLLDSSGNPLTGVTLPFGLDATLNRMDVLRFITRVKLPIERGPVFGLSVAYKHNDAKTVTNAFEMPAREDYSKFFRVLRIDSLRVQGCN